MNLQTFFERLERLHQLINRKSTGSPAELAKKLGATERTVFNWIALMKEMGAPIAFCRLRQTYLYEKDVELQMGFREITDTEKRKIEGGRRTDIQSFFCLLHH